MSRIDATRYEQFVDSVPDAIVATDKDGAVLLVNGHAETMFGYSRAEMLGQPVEMLIPARFDQAHRRHRARYFSNPRAWAINDRPQVRGRRKDGVEFDAVVGLGTIETDAGILAVATVRDVTEQRRAERMYEQFVNLGPDAIVGADAHGLIVLVNAQTEALFGYTRDELLSEPLEILIPDRYREIYVDHRTSYFADPRPTAAQLELCGRRKDGSEFPAEVSLSTVTSEDGPLAIAAIRDTTARMAEEREREALQTEAEESRVADGDLERQALEQQLGQMRRLESVGQLAGGIAHDFNNLLGVIINYSAFVAEEIDGDSAAQHDLLQIRRAAERAAGLTRQLLIFSRREVVRPRIIDLNDIAAGVDRLLRRALGEHVELETRYAPDLWAVEADPGQVEQVIVNLAVNARDAMHEGGRLLIETANAELDQLAGDELGLSPGHYVVMRVTDAGEGMDAATVARAFEPFFTTKPRGEGTGLGLSTVYGIVADAGGDVKIYTEENVGTTVRVYLPASPHTATRTKPVVAEHPLGHGERILVAEDDDDVRNMVQRILSQAGYEVLVAPSGPDALQTLGATDPPIELLLTDLVMPEMLGPEVAERARLAHPDLAIVFMTGYSDQMLGPFADADDIAVIEKPFTAEALLVGIRDGFERN